MSLEEYNGKIESLRKEMEDYTISTEAVQVGSSAGCGGVGDTIDAVDGDDGVRTVGRWASRGGDGKGLSCERAGLLQ